jgi:glycosyltransferase involved in cell wall biosynthesis
LATGGKLPSAGRKRSADLAQSYPLSAIVPVRNAEATLLACLQALEANRTQHLEVIVVDDGSTDGTAEILQTFAAHATMPVQRIRNDRPTGPAAARNLGMDRASHHWLLFLDSDVVLPSNAIESIRESLRLYSHRPEVVGVLGTYHSKIPHSDFISNYKNLLTCFLYDRTETLSPFLHTPIFCVQREILIAAGGFDASLRRGEDFQLGVRLGSRGFRFVIDRRVRGVHLKKYDLKTLLREDWRTVQALQRVPLDRVEKRFALKAHRWSRIASLLLPGASLATAAAALRFPEALPLSLLLAGLFAVVNANLFFYLTRRRGLGFAAAGLAFLFIQMLWAEVALAVGLLRRRPVQGRGSGEQSP